MGFPTGAWSKVNEREGRTNYLSFITANYEISVVKNLPPDFATGVYCGWASVDDGDVHKMVMSVGWNPFFDNKEKSMVCEHIPSHKTPSKDSYFIFQETHILHKFSDPNLYDRVLKVCITNFLRPEANFTTVENLIVAINGDIETAKQLLDSSPELKTHEFFTATIR